MQLKIFKIRYTKERTIYIQIQGSNFFPKLKQILKASVLLNSFL